MDVERQIAYWRDGANEDFEVALVLMETGRVRHALFFAELALEKMLKAHVVKTLREVPPRTHNLIRLLELAELRLTEKQQEFLGRFQEYCLEGRYPESVPVPLDSAEAKTKMNQCQEMLQWLMNRFD